ncbi:Membrane transporter of cations and cationic drugs [Thermoplasmatales archaeon BRNA1]|nr:Membrane transporter of cations and cationic drugs [Thermoplasmatales archaeon BRNA1]
MNPWFYITVAGLIDILGAYTTALSDSLNKPLWLIPMWCFAFISIAVMNKGIAMKVPPGPAYAVWVGIADVGTLVFDIIVLGDRFTAYQILAALVIIVGVIGVQYEGSKDQGLSSS